MTEEIKETFREKDRVRKEELKEKKPKISDEKKELNRIKDKHRKREMRSLRSGKDHLIQNLQAKKGMA